MRLRGDDGALSFLLFTTCGNDTITTTPQRGGIGYSYF
ncbi:hypothetical protein AYM02_06320 [Coxiella burnetii]|nr:hypothetical protein COXBURSA331_A0742 [Coxiella burnetii RSA 331]AML48955.1 hypothetical protein AUR58_07015 [Coxiella burnetii]ATN86363.1 hypothetical protein AYO29_07935 [Coxiella burnetii str. Schperling]EAX32934.2 hypothetical protein A35_08275 [Coxiella burnetii 'MSU Goat Q177']EDR36052.1 hypothetical protein COXBURSA334_1618 [Coxiella burnetii Q321]